MRELSAAQADDLYELVSERGHRQPAADPDLKPGPDWYALFPNPVVAAESLLDRLINTSHQILMEGPSYRSRKPDPAPASPPTSTRS